MQLSSVAGEVSQRMKSGLSPLRGATVNNRGRRPRSEYAEESLYVSPKSERDVDQVDVPVALWVAAILLFGFGDSLTSALAFSAGAYEGNWLMVQLVGMLGGSLWAFIAVKTAVLAILFFVSYYMLPRHGWLVAAILCVVGSYLVLNNLITFFTII